MFENILGNDRIKTQLERDLRSRRLHHAYLFSGPDHIGKMALAREFVSELRTGKAFDEKSPFASQWNAGEGPGLLIFFDRGESLKVEEVKKIQQHVFRRTAEDSTSFCIIENAERMTRSTANSFLKILEEPSERFVFILTTRQEQKLLPTIRSRCVLFRFNALPTSFVEHSLRTRSSDELLIQDIKKLSGGKIGLAVRLLSDKAFLERLARLWDFAMLVMEKDLPDLFTLAEHLSSDEFDKSDLLHFFRFLAEKLRQDHPRAHLPQLSNLQRMRSLFQDTQVNRRLQLEDYFLKNF